MRSATCASWEPLLPAEAMLLAGCAAGQPLRAGDGSMPVAGDAARAVRGEWLRSLLAGAFDTRAHARGLRLMGAHITGQLDLQNVRIAADVHLLACRFDAPIVLQSAAVDSLFLDGSCFPGMMARRLEARGNLYVRDADITGPVELRGARIGGEMVLDGVRIVARDMIALEISYVETRGDLAIRSGTIEGDIKAWGIAIAGDMILSGIAIHHPGSVALNVNNARISGDVDLRGARILGSTTFIAARIETDFALDAGRFEAPGMLALDLNRAAVGGALFLRSGMQITGALSLNGARAGALVDDPESWPKPGDLLLNRFTYSGIIASRVDAAARLDWLSRQDPSRWGEDFWSQPYEQLATVLTAMGHQDDARAVAFRKEQLQRRARRARARHRLTRALLRVKDGALRLTVGYGLNPFASFYWLAGFWAVGVVLMAMADAQGVLRPNISVFLRSPEWVLCGAPPTERVTLASLDQTRPGLAAPGQTQFACFRARPEAASLPAVNPFVFSLEAVLPGLDAGQRQYWSPDTRFPLGVAAKVFEYIQHIAGFTLGILAVAGFSGLVKSR